MRPDEKRDHLTRALLQPIRIFLSDGSLYDVGHPEIVAVSRRAVVIGPHVGNDRLPERFARPVVTST